MYGPQNHNFTLVAGNAVPKYHIVAASGSSGATGMGWLAASLGTVLVGVAQAAVIANDHMSVCGLGFSRLVAGSSVALGARITASASGRAVTCGSGSVSIGYALEAASADGDTFEAFIMAAQQRA